MKRPRHRQAVKPEGAGARDARRTLLLGVSLMLGTIIVYLPVWHAGLIWDDGTFVVNNPLIRRAGGLYQFWFSTRPVDYYPVTSSMLWLEWRLWGNSPLGYHLVNVLLHSLNAVLIWRALKWLNLSGAWLAAALFAVHPVNVESVAWITERKNPLAMFFYILSIISYLRFDSTHGPSRLAVGSVDDVQTSTTGDQQRWYWLSLGTFVLALLSKTTVAPLPILLLGLAWWQRGRGGTPRHRQQRAVLPRVRNRGFDLTLVRGASSHRP